MYRKPGTRVFFTTADPSVHYELTCGNCQFPITEDDPLCPRCQERLEHCPVCSDCTQTRAPKREPDHKGERTCPVCGVKRVAFGDLRLSQLKGSFCGNIYGCPAGGLLLRTNEFALLPEKASLCPICRDESLRPFDVKTFSYHVSRCVFCSTCFRPASDWTRGWGEGHDNLDRVVRPQADRDERCALCGRDDRQPGGPPGPITGVVIAALRGDNTPGEDPVDDKTYLSMAELGRLMILEKNDERMFDAAFRLWFQPNAALVVESQPTLKIQERVSHLVEGTLEPEVRRVLVRRTLRFLELWERKLMRKDRVASRPSAR